MKNTQDTILRLQTYITKLKQQATNPPERRKTHLKEYLEWLKLEVDKTEITIERFKV